MTETDRLVDQLRHVAKGLGETFAPFCEVVLHDLRDPSHTIIEIANNISGRSVGQASTELGLARIADPDFPQVIANYENRFPDGRPAKSTSIGIKDKSGDYVAALCLNIDTSAFTAANALFTTFIAVNTETSTSESLDATSAETIREHIEAFAFKKGTIPRMLSLSQRRELNRELRDSGLFELRKSVDVIAESLGVSRATVYADVK